MQVSDTVAGDRTSPWVNRLVTAITVVAEFAAIYYWSHWAHTHGLTRAATVPWLILFTVSDLLSTVVHECGHAFFAWGCYMKLLSFNAGPIQWHKRDGAWQFKFHPAGFVDLGGSVRVVPTNPKQPRIHELWTLFAGPLANILFGLLLLWAVLNSALPWYPQTWKLAAFTASFCFIAAITNLFPFMTEDGGYSDGARMLQIITKSPLDDFHRTLNSLAVTTVSAQRYRDLDVQAIERAAARFPSEVRGLNLLLCACNCYQDAEGQDTNQLPAARAALSAAEAIYDNYSIDLPARLHPPFVIGHAYLNRDAAAARLWWDRMEAKKSERQNVDYWLAQTALYWIEGRPQEAAEAWQNAEDEAQKLPETGSGDWDRDRCSLLRRELNKPLSAPVPRPASRAATRTPISEAALSLADRISPTPPATPAPIAARVPALVAATVPALADAPDDLANFSLLDRIAPSRRSPAADTPPAVTQPAIPDPEPLVAAVDLLPAVAFTSIPEPEPLVVPVYSVRAVALAATPAPESLVFSIEPESPALVDPIAPSWLAPAADPVPFAAFADAPADPADFEILSMAAPIASAAQALPAEAPSHPVPFLLVTASPTEDSAPATDWNSIFAEIDASVPVVDWVEVAASTPEDAPDPAAAWSTIADPPPTGAASSPIVDADAFDNTDSIHDPSPIDDANAIDELDELAAWAARAALADAAAVPAAVSAPAPGLMAAAVALDLELIAATSEPVETAPPPPKPVETARFDPLKHIREAGFLQEANRVVA